MNNLGDAALEYAARGYRVIPCVPGDKQPATKHGLLDATDDTETICRWWAENPRYNVAISTDGLCVVDVDVLKDGSPNPWLGSVPDSLEPGAVSCTPRGGLHWWFRQNGVELRNTTSKIANRVDTRATGGYVMVAPSRTEDGCYSWSVDLPQPEKLPVVPHWIEQALTRPTVTKAPAQSTFVAPVGGADVLERARRYLAKIPGAVSGQGGHGQTFRAACHMRKGFSLSDGDTLSLLREWNTTCLPPWSEKELIHKVEDAAKANLPDGYLLSGGTIPAWIEGCIGSGQSSSAVVTEFDAEQDAVGTSQPGIATSTTPATQQRILTAAERFPLFNGAALDALDCRIEFLIHNFLVAGQPCIVAGPKKALKTGLLLDMAISLASGMPCLGQFIVPTPRNVLVMTGESGEGTIQETARRIAAAKGVELSSLDRFKVAFNLPLLVDRMDLIRLEELIVSNELDVVAIDPAYLAFSGLEDAGNLFQVGKLLWALTEIGQRTSATIIIAHHTKKNSTSPYAQPELGDIAWSGFPEWARQWALLNRREPYDPESGGVHHLWLSVGGSAGHGGAWSLDISEGLRTDIGGRFWSVGLGSAREEKESRDDDRATAKLDRKERQRQAQLEGDAEKLLRAIQKFPGGETERTLREAVGLSGTRSGPAFMLLEERGDIRPVEVQKGGKTYDGYQPTSGTSGTEWDTSGTSPTSVPVGPTGTGTRGYGGKARNTSLSHSCPADDQNTEGF